MCLLVVASRVVPEWPLVVAANRDERYDRPAAPVQELRAAPYRTVGGRDLRAGGTWLAANDAGVVAGLTNKPADRDPARRSRGEIPLALTATENATSAVEAFGDGYRPGRYNPCWVLVGDRTALYLLDLTLPDRLGVTALGPGVHVLENRAPGDPSTKVDRVHHLLGPGPWEADDLRRRLRAVLRDHVVTEPGSLVSACCVHSDGYGTRSAMLVRDPASPTEPPEVWAADGPSCTAPLVSGGRRPSGSRG